MLGRRIRFIRLVLVAVFLLLTARLVDIQVLSSGQYRAASAQELTQPVTIPALRGSLYDRNGQLLALSIPTKAVLADDFQVQHPVSEALALAPLLGTSPTRLAAQLQQRSGYVPLATNVSLTRANEIAAGNFQGINLVDSSVRKVPNGNLAAPVIGMVNGSGAGAAGLEYEDNRLLAGKAGSEQLLESPTGVPLPGTPVEKLAPSDPGTGLELTLDEPLQYETEQALGAQIVSSNAVSGVAVVMDVKTGDILSMANLVANDAGAGASAISASSQPDKAITIGPGGPVNEAPSNLAVSQLYEPGSVFKLVTFSAALQDGVISPNSTFSVPDQIRLDGSTFHDAEPHPTEELTATQILAQSSNIGTSEIAEGLGESRLLQQVHNLGFGQATSLDFPGESPGLLIGPSQWEPTDLVSLPIGQVDAVNALQVLDMYNAVANGGVFIEPRLVRATVSPGGAVAPAAPSATHRVISPATDAELTSMLEQVVDVGTGTSAVVPGYTVAGKTGTAQIPTVGRDSYVTGAYMASFVGFAPAVNPTLAAIVVLDRPTPIFGGTVAAPVFAKIMSYALHRYDIPTTPGASTQGPQGATAASQTQDIT
ncbi:MAG: peptidoglycan D,D-transpeptidase FtsI family protein [Acidimicrobiales bacterium]